MTLADMKSREIANDVTSIETLDKSEDSSSKNKENNEAKSNNWFQFKTQVVWSNVIIFTLWHLVTVYYMFTFPYLQYKGLMLWVAIMFELNMLGTTGGVHRLWAHRAYKAKWPLRVFYAIFWIATGGYSITGWVTDHRIHHKWTDTDADPHSIGRGFFYSHIGWQLMRKSPENIARKKDIDISDLKADPVVVFFDRHYRILKLLLCFILPVAIPVYFFNQDLKAAIITQWFFRYPWALHAMFAVNSFAHFYGYRSYDRTIMPADNSTVALLTMGEGWHNYHHAFPWDYKAAELGSFLFNRTSSFIRLCKNIGLTYDLKEPTPEMIKRLVERKGDGSHPIYSIGDQSNLQPTLAHAF